MELSAFKTHSNSLQIVVESCIHTFALVSDLGPFFFRIWCHIAPALNKMGPKRDCKSDHFLIFVLTIVGWMDVGSILDSLWAALGAKPTVTQVQPMVKQPTNIGQFPSRPQSATISLQTVEKCQFRAFRLPDYRLCSQHQ